MAGAGLVAIKRRIKSINNTKKITNAVGLVATSKLRKTRKSLKTNDNFYNNLREIMLDALNNMNVKDNMYVRGNGSDKKIFISLTSDTGLCGGFNAGVFQKTREVKQEEKDKFSLISVGEKGRAFFKKVGYETLAEYVDIPDIPTISDAKTIVDKAFELYRNKEVGEVYVIYTRFISTVKQEVVAKKILPFDSSSLIDVKDDINEEIKPETKYEYIGYEPEGNRFFDSIASVFLRQTMLNAMLNAKVSEQNFRMTAMEGATKNANDLLDKLNLKYNRIRQSVITQEISEIVGGAEAQK